MKNLPSRLSLEQFLTAYPGDQWDKPLPSLKAFDELSTEGDKYRLAWLVDWIEPQTTCAYIMHHHGAEGLKRVVAGIAHACAKHQVHMGKRVRAMAGILGLEIF